MTEPDLESRYRVAADDEFRLDDHDPADTAGLDRECARTLRASCFERLRLLQTRLYAERRQSLLVVVQGVDACGKDGTIARLMSGVDPSIVRVTAFKVPSAHELAHDWLWRCVVALPERGQIGIFNRSHYEEVVTVRVHPEHLAAQAIDPERARDEQFWEGRMETIRAWERHLVSCRTRVVKFFLHVSKKEQRKRLLKRATDPEKQWKFSTGDVAERAHWEAYQGAYEAALRATSTRAAPWYAVPADHKWLARAAVVQIVTHHVEQMGPRFPELDEEARRAVSDAARLLEAERPRPRLDRR